MKIKFKKILLLFVIFLVGLTAKAQQADFTLTVKMEKTFPGYKAFLQYKKDKDSVMSLDSTDYANGQYIFKGFTSQPQRALLFVEAGNKGFLPNWTKESIPVYLEKGNVLVEAGTRLKGAKMSGTPLNNDLQGYYEVLAPFKKHEDSLSLRYGAARKINDSEDLDKLTLEFISSRAAKQKAEEAYFFENLNSQVSLDWMKQNMNIPRKKTEVLKMFAKMGEQVKSSPAGREFVALLKSKPSVEIGASAPNFISKDIKGENISLDSFKGKYVLLDFWASWCGPCRIENPNVLKAFKDFASHGFTVVGFSMDDAKQSWVNAVDKDGMPWVQLSDLKGASSDIALMYGITAIPSNFLIDPKGKIIALDLRGEDLHKELRKIFNM